MSTLFKIALILTVLITGLFQTGFAQDKLPDQPALEIYGKLPAVRSVALSDTGNKVAILRADAEGDYVLVQDLVSR